MKKILKDKKGISAADALVAVTLVVLFAGIIATLSYNIYLSSTSIKRQSKAIDYIINVFEYVDKTYYDDVTIDNIKYYVQNENIFDTSKNKVELYEKGQLIENGTIGNTTSSAYTIVIDVTKYKDTVEEDILDLVMEVTVTVNYKLDNKDQSIQMKRIKQRETLITPNIPQIDKIEKEENEIIYPIKYVQDHWEIVNQNDKEWYNYFNGYWATVLKTDQALQIGQTIQLNNDSEVFVWIPRYAYNGQEIKFLYKNTNNYVENQENYSTLISINDTEWTTDFEEEDGSGVWLSNSAFLLSGNLSVNLNAQYQRKNTI